MWKGIGQRKPVGGRGSDGQGTSSAPEVVVVAVDADKNSQHALKWAADHVITRGQIFILLHVRKKILSIPTPAGFQIPISEVDEEIAATFFEQLDLRTKELLLPFQCFCNRRGLQCKEVILEDVDIPKAIIDFICHQTVDKLVMGASSRNAFTRTFKASDVPSSVYKVAPDFCSIYVVSKGKISSIRPATNPNKYPNARPAHGFDAAENRFQSIKSEPEVYQNKAIGGPTLSHGPKTNVMDSVPKERYYGNRSNEKVIGKVPPPGEPLDCVYQSVTSCPSLTNSSTSLASNHSQADSDGDVRRSQLSYIFNGPLCSNEVLRVSESSQTSNSSWSSRSGSNGHVYSVSSSSEEPRTTSSASHLMNMNFEELRVETSEAEERSSSRLEMAHRERQKPRAWPESAPAEQKVETEANTSVDKKFLQELVEKKKMLDCIPSDVQYRRYSVEEIQAATDNFSDTLKIGEGGYGPVFRSTLDHSLVAIKILKSNVSQGMKQFQREMEVLSTIRHPNMVQLMGACPEYGCLVYEFMANGSLEDCLFCQANTAPLSWQLRFKIASEIATGLLFLHQTKPEPIVHRDLKPGNILLDHNFVSKIADVGLARLIPRAAVSDTSTQYHMTAAAGTFCYIDPEYQKTGMLGIKSDIYALGIILLQLITGAPPMGLAHNVEMAMETGRFEKMLDPKVTGWPMEDARKFAELALKCAELRRRDRPDLGSVVLPELNRLRALAESTEQPPLMQHQERSRSCKEPMRNPIGMSFDDGTKTGTSFC